MEESTVYRAAYDAVTNQLDGLNAKLTYAVDCLEAKLSGAIDLVKEEMCRPSILLRPTLYSPQHSGRASVTELNKWVAVYGNVGSAVFGVGDSVDEAMRNFDKAVLAKDHVKLPNAHVHGYDM